MDFKEIKGTKHYIYDNKDEFSIDHPDIPVRHNWRHGEEGEWVSTDDGFVCQILRKLNIKEKSVYIEHVKGYVELGEISIIIAVACPRRSEAYDLSRYIIEEIKKRSPIWKKEHYKDKEGEWLKGNPIQTN